MSWAYQPIGAAQLLLGATTTITASLSLTDATDSLSASVSNIVSAAVSKTDDSDTLSSSAETLISAVLSLTDAEDTLSASSSDQVSASVNLTDATDTLSAAISNIVNAALSSADENDTLLSSVESIVSAVLSVTDANDTLVGIIGDGSAVFSLSVVDGADTLSSTTSVLISAALSSNDANDSVASTIVITVPPAAAGSRLRVLFFDPNSSALGFSDRPMAWQLAFWSRLGALIEYANSSTPSGSTIWSTTYDIIVVPWIRNVVGSYTNLSTMLARFSGNQAAIPCYVGAAREPSLSPSVSGCSAMSSTTTDASYQSTGIKNWLSRNSTQITWFATPPTLAGQSGCTVHSDDGTHAFLWSNTVQGHPVLWQAGITGSAPNAVTSSTKFWRPWYAAQWMCDLNAAKKAKLRRMYVPIRFDGYDNFTQSSMDVIYAAAEDLNANELWLAAVWSGTLSGPLSSQESWWIARQKSNGGLIRGTQHMTDLVDGTTGGAASIISTDGNALDQYATADATYKGHCDQLTSRGWILGSDGYGRGTVNVQNANSMNNAVAHYLAGRGLQLWLLLSGAGGGTTKLYPDAPAAATVGQTTRRYPAPWNGGWPIYSWSADSYTSGGVSMSRSWPSALIEGMVYGGGAYVHQSGIVAYEANCVEMFDQYSTCPDVVSAGPLEDMIAEQKRGPRILVPT